MSLRSTVFLTLSLVVHAACITALTLSHFKNIEPANEEVSGGVTLAKAEAVGPAPEIELNIAEFPQEIKSAKPIAKANVKPVKKPKPTKTAQPKVATTLPPKEAAPEEAPIEKMSPDIDDADAVVVADAAPTQQEEPEDKIEMIPVVEKLSAVEPMDDESAGLGQGGSSKGEAVDYGQLKQFSGNTPPLYPLLARKEKRQGEVELLYRVTKEGRVAEIQVAKSSGHADLDESAVKAIAQYRFVPGQEGWARHPVIFALKGESTELPSKLRSNSAGVE